MSDIFEAKPSGEQPTNADIKLEDFVGEGKKYADVNAFVKSKVELDRFLAQVLEENKGLREVVNKESNAEANLLKLNQEIAELKAKLNKSAEPSPNTTGELTTGQLESIVANVITKQERDRTASQNLAAANSLMVKTFGSQEKAKEIFENKASQIGMSVEELKAIAAKSPTAFSQLMGIQETRPANGVDMFKPAVNAAALPNTNGQPKKGSRAYYNNLRKELGNTKFFADVKLQKEIFEAKKAGLYDSQ